MDTRSHSPSPRPDVELPQDNTPPIQDKISAYYSLVFPGWTFYIQTLAVTIGRRCAPNANVPTSSSSSSEQAQVDVDLGNLKSVSRLHAKIEYDQEEDRFVLVVIGRNGAWVDGVWCSAGTRATLGERSHIQIASRTFTFVLPPPSPPEDTPSPSSQSSANRARSPSVDITSISPPSSQPSNSPPPRKAKLPSPSPEPQIEILSEQPQLPNSNLIGKGKGKGTGLRKRKKGDVEPAVLERPEVMPPKPPFTYAQLIYRAIKAIDGKATLQEICNWITTTYDYYKFADSAWMSSVRHNLSSSRAFLKMERCGGDRGKGFFWSVDEKYAQSFEDQETKAQQSAAGQGSSSKDGSGKPGKRKDKNAPLDPPLKRSIKGEPKGPLPPPLTSVPLLPKAVAASPPTVSTPAPVPNPNTNAPTGVFAYNAQAQASSSSQGSPSTKYPVPPPNPYAALTQQHWTNVVKTMTSIPIQPSSSTLSTANTSNSSTTSTPTPATMASISSDKPILPPINTNLSPPFANSHPAQQNSVPDVVIPIVLGPVPATHVDYAPGHPNNSVKAGYMILHDRKLILDPDVFSGLTPEMLTELEKVGAMAAVKVLTGHMVRALKERRAKNKNKDKSAKKAAKAAKKAAVAAAAAGSSAVGLNDGKGSEIVIATPSDVKPLHSMIPAIPTSGPVAEEGHDMDDALADPGSPIIVIDDSEGEGPAMKRRKLNDDRTNTVGIIPLTA